MYRYEAFVVGLSEDGSTVPSSHPVRYHQLHESYQPETSLLDEVDGQANGFRLTG